MKKTLLTIAALAAASALNAQTVYNYFDPADCDADGWLWFNTQEKLDKYCGFTSDYKIVLSGAQFEDAEGQYPDCTLDPTIFGYDKEGYQYVMDGENPTDVRAEGTWTGAIITPQAKSYGMQNGGGIILHLPDCAEFSVAMSSESRIRQMILMGSKQPGDVERIDLGVVKGYAYPFQSLSTECQFTWSNLQNFENANTGLTIYSPAGTPVTAGLFNDMTTEVLIQGIKVLTYTDNGYGAFTPGAGVEGIWSDDADAPVEFYNMQGVKVSGNEPGLSIRRQGSKSTKVIIKYLGKIIIEFVR